MFCLYPHQTAYVVPAAAVTVVPDDVPASRAVLAGTVETAVNALWDVPPLLGDRVTVVGAGMVGCCVARLLARSRATQVTLVDVDPTRGRVAAALGVDFAAARRARGRPRPRRARQRHRRRPAAVPRAARPPKAPSSTSAGTATPRSASPSAARSTPTGCASGPARSARWRRRAAAAGRTADRLALALELLADPAFDVLFTG